MEGIAAFPLRRVLETLAGFLGALLAFSLVPFDPADEMPALAAPPRPLPALRGLEGPPAPGERRLFVVGASLAAGYPFQPEPAASFGALLEAGLAPLHPQMRILVRPAAKPALDSPRLAEIVAAVLPARPSLVCVALGSNENSNRVFFGRPLLPRGPVERLIEAATRGRALLRPLQGMLPGGGAPDETAVQGAIADRILKAGPGRPSVEGLPVTLEEQEHLLHRLRRSMGAMHRQAAQAAVPLVFLIAPTNPAGIWPFAVLADAASKDADRLVAAFRKGEREGLAESVAEFLRRAPGRADLHFLQGLLLREQGRQAEADAAFQSAQDLDQAPMHLTSRLAGAIQEEARRLGRPCLDLNVPLRRAGSSLADPDLFLDHGHLVEQGQLAVALFLAEELARLGHLPPLPRGGARTFRAAAEAHLAARVDPASRRRAAANMDWAVGNYHLLFGNFRDALPRLTRAFQAGHTGDPGKDAPFALHLMFCAYGLAGRTELPAGPDTGEAYYRGVHSRLVAAAANGCLEALVERVAAGGEP